MNGSVVVRLILTAFGLTVFPLVFVLYRSPSHAISPNTRTRAPAPVRAASHLSEVEGEELDTPVLSPRDPVTSSTGTISQQPTLLGENSMGRGETRKAVASTLLSQHGVKGIDDVGVTMNGNSPYRYQGGRRYLRDPALVYPLPVDLTELHRQLMRMLLCIRLHGKPFRNEVFNRNNPPKKVLELACGGAFWSSACHDHFKSHGHDKISFTGLDLAPLPPDLRSSGLDWKFVQHDIRNGLNVFADNTFDFIFVKDASFLRQDGIVPRQNPLSEALRVLQPGGVIEVWDADCVFRTLVPNPTLAKDLAEDEVELAKSCGVYPIDPSTSFAQTRNTALAQYNSWIESALEKRHLPTAPCAYITWMFTAHADELDNYGSCRIAVPFSEMRWEKESKKPPLNNFQLSLRQSALQNSLDFMDAIEPLLKEESGKRQDEWDRWKAGLVSDLVNGHGAADGECLEIGAWWATKY